MKRKTDSVVLLILILVFLTASMLFVSALIESKRTNTCLDIVQAERKRQIWMPE